MKRPYLKTIFLISALCALSLTSAQVAAECVSYTPELRNMSTQEDRLISVNDFHNSSEKGADKKQSSHPITYRVADDGYERAAGFQYICASTIEEESILFVFDKPFKPSFHMNNVWGILDIAFIDEDGVIIDIQTMHPYSILSLEKKLYSPPSPIKYALEARPNYFKDLGVIVGKTRLASLSKEADLKN